MIDTFDPLLLARIQFAFTVSAHIVFPAFSIGLASFLAVLEALWLLTKDDAYIKVFDYWKVIFAVAFGMGVVSGIVMSYQFGTNWSVFSDKTGPVLGPLMGYEVLSAFFLEAGFLGVMLFGFHKVGPRLHFMATAMVAVGTLFSAFWILSVNSWMHTPAGYGVNEVGQFIALDWWAVVFNPSFPYRLVHMVLAAYLTTAFVVGGVGAWHLLRDSRDRGARIMFSMAMWMALLVAPLQVIVGDFHGLNTLKHQPAKIAAMEGHYETQKGAPLILFGIPDDDAEETKYAVEIPNLGSLILTHELEGEVQGLKAWPKEDRPSAAIAMAPSGFIAVLAGWITTEVGRQPWTVYGLLRTADSVSPIGAAAVASSLAAFVIVYITVFGAGVFYIMRLMSKRPDAGTATDIGPSRAAGITPMAAIRRALPGREN